MKNKIILTLGSILTATTLLAQTPDKTKLDQYMDILEANNKYMGSVAIAKDGKIIYSRSTGFADVENNKKNTAATKFRIGSISKMFTATMVFKAIEEKKLKLTDKLDTYYPNIPEASTITIAQMLSHRSGIHNFTNDPSYYAWSNIPQTEAQMIENITRGGSDFEPDTKADYSNANYVLLSYILEKTYKKPYKELLNEKIIKPLKLTNTYMGGKINPAANEANSYGYMGKWEKDMETDMSVPMGAGAVVSNPTDLSQFIEALFSGKLVSQASLEQMKTLRDEYGMGMFRFPFEEKKSYGHSGGIDGFTSFLAYFPNEKVTLAMTSNGANMNTNDLSINLLSWAFGKPFEIPEFKTYNYTTAELDQLIGIYTNTQMPVNFVISTNGKILSAQASGQQSFPLESAEKNIFTFSPAGITITFYPETKRFIIEQGGGSYTFTKKED
ncbi:serine hydrolase domain-containing protein [Flavobacterium suzhouense]|uniref:Serine hydrolase domain-containing protein n=1 Tax=Flavobacterium suzhouense TaxID=1529638 RepID=A0ABW5NQ65_9FLAO